METLPAAITVASGLAAGLCVGLVGGFGLAANADASSGVTRAFSSPLLRWIARPPNDLSIGTAIAYLMGLALWLAIFCALCAAPFFVATKLSIEDSYLAWVTIAPLVIGILFGKPLGRRLWLRVPTI